jgi:hypothetical protein
MARVLGFLALAVVIGVAAGVVLDRVLLGMLVSGGILLLGIVMLISRAEDDPDRVEPPREF